MASPDDRRYTTSHEYAKVDGSIVTVGITQHAADELTDITYVDLPKAGDQVQAGQPFGEIESVKATSDVYAPVSGTIAEVNSALEDEPGLLNSDPFEKGWLIKIEAGDTTPLDSLLSAEDYDKQLS